MIERLLRTIDAAASPPLIGFATGATFAPFFTRLANAFASGRLTPDAFVATHLDEYLGFGVDRRGGMVDELFRACPAFRAMHATGRFLAVPSDGTEASIAAHERRIDAAGGIALQLVGIGRNGHVAFAEPGTDPRRGFHRTVLAASTRADAVARFAPDEPPREAVTAGIRSILAAHRIVLVAIGASKADAIAAMATAPNQPECPASFLRAHPRSTVVVDPEAGARLPAECEDSRS